MGSSAVLIFLKWLHFFRSTPQKTAPGHWRAGTRATGDVGAHVERRDVLSGIAALTPLLFRSEMSSAIG